MTYAPSCCMAARAFLISIGIPGKDIGCVGDTSHQSSGGYHVGNDVLARIGKLDSDYSKRESAKDRPGSDAAMALDVGGLGPAALIALFKWLVAQCEAGAPDTQNIREIIGTRDGKTVVRWDRLGIRSSGDSSHLYHIHISYFRSSEGQDKTSLFRRYFRPAAPPAKVDEMAVEICKVVPGDSASSAISQGPADIAGQQRDTVWAWTYAHVLSTEKALAELDAKVTALSVPSPAPVTVDADALRAVLTEPAFLAALAKAVNDDDARRMAE